MEPHSYHIAFIKHSQLTHQQLIEICNIKAIAWPYSIESQIKWIKENIAENDIHVMLYKQNELLAYMNLVAIEITVNSIKEKAWGIGNVCAKEKHKGYGTVLMNEVTGYLLTTEKIGLLFCNVKLTDFYSKYGWKLLDAKQISLGFNNTAIETMVFNLNNTVRLIDYQGKSF